MKDENSEKPVTTGFTITQRHLEQLKELEKLGIFTSKSDVIRQAINFFYEAKVNKSDAPQTD